MALTVMNSRVVNAALFAGLLIFPAFAQAANMSFHGTLIEPPVCTISDQGMPPEVNFGDRVGVTKVDGENYRKVLKYKIECDSAGSGLSLKLSLKGTPATFDAQAIQSSQPNLGVRIYRNSIPFAPGSTLTLSGPTRLPLLQAVPVKKTGAKLVEGPFEAWATLSADYE